MGRVSALIALLAVAGCPSQQVKLGPVPVIDPSSSVPACAAQPSPRSSDLCAGEFTGDLWPCARCARTGCRDARWGVYCVVGADCSDPRCLQPVAPALLPATDEPPRVCEEEDRR